MANTKITVLDNGPFLVNGDVEVLDPQENKFSTQGPDIYLCRCGLSKNKPFCDGSHEGKFESKETAK